jgi:hypothetical protein
MNVQPNIVGPGLIKDFQLALDPVAFSREIGIDPDEWQSDLMRCQAMRILLNCSRQSGKSTTAGTLSTHIAIYQDGAQTAILAPGMRQGRELYRKVHWAYVRAGKPIKARKETQFELELTNDSRVIVLPGTEATARGISGIDYLLIEEASRVPDEAYFSVRPMIATRPRAKVIIMSTPFGTRGFYYEEWKRIVEGKMNILFDGQSPELSRWAYFEIPAEKCPRITPEFLEEERLTMGPWWFAQEYECKFMDAQTSAFRSEDIARIVSPEVATWDL